ncbi:MAG TPA: EAL domain-containing protein [Thermoanaerobaculia bacterium]|nr:EAL domain-containing protein [Thermoanaerobaculia bacterium]
MSRLWELILQPNGLTTVFQPIFDARNGPLKLFSLEALTRGPRDTNIERSDILFEYVRRKRREAEVDMLSMAAALRMASSLPLLPSLSLNVHAVTLERERRLPLWLAEQCAEHGVPLDRLIIEIVEHAPPWSGPQFLENLDRLRSLGVRIALDDVGLGQSNFRMMVDCRPELLKIDRYFVDGCHADPLRRAVLESISELACRLGARSVAEGIEDERDVATVTATGISLFQGYLFCRPCSAAALASKAFMATARETLSSTAAASDSLSPLT